MINQEFHEITPALEELAAKAQAADVIDSSLYVEHDVKRGLRDLNGVGVLAGLTHVSEVRATKVENGVKVPDYGNLFYRGYNIKDLIGGLAKSGRFGFEEVAYLLLFGSLPTEEELKNFSNILIEYRQMPTGFVRDVIMKKPSMHIMNTLSRSVLTLYAYDDNGNDISLPGIVRQCMELIARFPQLSVYGYYAYQHEKMGESMYIIPPLDHGSYAENLLHILRPDGKYTEVEARVLDACLLLHMDHGGGNNSTFTTHVVSSTNTDAYSVMAAALGSLKGPRHGGANIMVTQMFEDLEQNVGDWKDDDEVTAYLKKLLHKEAFDHSGLIYGVGHAVYSKSDPRAEVLQSFVDMLAKEKGKTEEYELYKKVAALAPEIIASERKMYKGACANVDFYSGFVYQMLGLPEELFTPLFAMARIVGWSAHLIEEHANNSKIIRPAYHGIEPEREYEDITERE
ncbi:MAG: citrate/2-methylcitrate synthase [Clostridia bacterium]|nr:citrate/2-methylcitrate synthase [Clostridia bacterium]